MRFIIVLFLFLWKNTEGQHSLYIPPMTIADSSEYLRGVNILLGAHYYDSLSPDCETKHNMFGAYYNLNAEPDTVFKYLQEALLFDPGYECWLQVFVTSHWTKPGNKKLEPKRIYILNRFCDSIYKTYDSAVIRTLDTLSMNDEKYRKNYGDAPWVGGNEAIWIEQYALDSINQIRLSRIMDKKGYPGKKLVGYEMRNKAFMIIQHANLPYQERYSALVEKAAQENQMDKENLPLLIDRMLMRKGLPQIYGTQAIWNKKKNVMELYKVRSYKDINILRTQYGLSKLSDYLKQNNYVLPDSN